MELTADEIETLRAALTGTPVDHDAIVRAYAILDRLSPPAPEVDEATRIYELMREQGYAADMRDGTCVEDAEISYLRQAIAELIASKDAEIADYTKALDEANVYHATASRNAQHYADQCCKLESELAALRAENEPPEGYAAVRIAARDLYVDTGGLSVDYRNGWYIVENKRLKVCTEAAERNTAEPERRLSSERAIPAGEVVRSPSSRSSDGSGNTAKPAKTHVWPAAHDDACSEIKAKHIETLAPLAPGEPKVGGWTSNTKYAPTEPATDTTPAVVVTQADRDAAKPFLDWLYAPRNPPEETKSRFHQAFALARTEAEARGRREALEEAYEALIEYCNGMNAANKEASFVDYGNILKRLMTEGK